VLEAELAEEIERLRRRVDFDAVAIDLSRKACQLVDHESADPFAPQLASDEQVIDENCVGGDLHCQHRHEIADELPDQPERGGVSGSCIRCKEFANRLRVAALERADEEPLTSHATLIVACGYSISMDIDMNQIILDIQPPRRTLRAGQHSPKKQREGVTTTMDVQQAIAEFLQHGQAVRNLSDRTLRAYQSDLTQFHVQISEVPTTEITPEHLETYLEKLGDSPYRDTSIRRKVAALKVFFRFLEERGIVNESPARRLKIKHPIENRVPTVLSTREIRSLLAAPKQQISELATMRDHSAGGRNRYFCAVRDSVILELLFSTGIRIGELVALNLADASLDKREIQITGRGTRGRIVPLSQEVIDGLVSYLELRGERITENGALFVGRSGTRLTIYSIENIFKKHVRLADIKRHITPHSLRHTMAAMLVSSGTDIRAVQEILGHASILSTQVYTKLSIQKGRRATAAVPARVFTDVGSAKLAIKKR